MHRYPVDSAEAAEFRELDATAATTDPATETAEHDPRCRGGWLGEDAHDHPIPCPTCRPHLIRRRGRLALA